MTEADLELELYPYHTGGPPEKAPFDTSAERFAESLYELRPAPNAYCIHGFTDMMRYFTLRHRPALINPKLGFLTSADARPKRVFRHSDTQCASTKLCIMNRQFQENGGIYDP